MRKNGLTQNSIRCWLRIFGLEDNPDPVMSKNLSQTEQELHDHIYELEKNIKLLETELKRSNMARDAIHCMIDLAEKKYNIPVRKNRYLVIRKLFQDGWHYPYGYSADCLAYHHRDITNRPILRMRQIYFLPA